MKTFAPLAVLLGMALMLAGCGGQPPPAPVASPDVPEIQIPDEPEPAPSPDAPAVEDDAADPPIEPSRPATGPDLGDPTQQPEMGEPAPDDSAATDDEKPGVTRALGAALLKGVSEGAAGSP